MAKTVKKGQTVKKKRTGRKNLKMRRSIMGTMSLLLMLTAVIVALIPVPKSRAVLNNDIYEAWTGAQAYIKEANPETESYFPKYFANNDMVFANDDGRLRVAYSYDASLDGQNVGVVILYKDPDSGVASSIDIPEIMPAFRLNSVNGVSRYVAVDSDGRFLYYDTDADENGDYSMDLCTADTQDIWKDRPLKALVNSQGLATEDLTDSYALSTVSGNTLGLALPDNVASSQLQIKIRYIGTSSYVYNIDPQGTISRNWPDGTMTDYSGQDEQQRGVFEGSHLQNVTIPGAVKAVGNRAFSGCSSLTGAVFGTGIASIGNEVFKNCTSLSSVTLKDDSSEVSKLEEIGNEAFSGCQSLSSISIPSSVERLGNFCFANCKSLTAPDLGADDSSTVLNTIGNGLFYGCDSLSQISFPDTVRLSGYSMGFNVPGGGSDDAVHNILYGCSALETMKLPKNNNMSQQFRYDNVTGCYKLHKVIAENNSLVFDCPSTSGSTPCDTVLSDRETFSASNLGKGYVDEDIYEIPDDFYIEGYAAGNSKVYDYALRHKLAFHYLDAEEYNDQYSKLVDGYIYYARMTADPQASLVNCKPVNAADPSTNVIIPETIGPCKINTIDSGAFSNPTPFEYLYVPQTISSIADNAFTKCSELRNVYFENANGITLGADSFRTNGSDAVVSDGGLRFFGDIDPNPDTDASSYPKTPFSYAMTPGNNYNALSATTDYINYCSEFPQNLETELLDGKPTLVSLPSYEKLQQTYEQYYNTKDAKGVSLAGYEDFINTTTASPEGAEGLYGKSEYSDFKSLLGSVMRNSASGMYPLSRYYSTDDGSNEEYDHSFYNEMRIAANAYARYFINNEPLNTLKEEEANVIRAILNPDISEGINYLADDLFREKDASGNVILDTDGSPKGNSHMETITMHSIAEIPDNEFEDCSSLKSVQMMATPAGGESIGEGAFKDCPNLQTAVIPSTVSSIGNLPFENDTALKAVSFIDQGGNTSDDGQTHSCRNGILMETENGNPKEIIECLELRGDVMNGFGSSVVSSDELAGASSIRDRAFEDCRSITSVDLSASEVGAIPEQCFMNSVNLRKVSLPASCGSLGKECFKNTAIGDLYVRNPNCNMNPTSAFTADNGTDVNGIKYLPDVMLYGYEGSSAQYVGDSPEYPTLHFSLLDDRKFKVEYYNGQDVIYSEEVSYGNPANFHTAMNIVMGLVDSNMSFNGWEIDPKTADLENVTMDIKAYAQLSEKTPLLSGHTVEFVGEDGERYGDANFKDGETCPDYDTITGGPKKNPVTNGNVRTTYTFSKYYPNAWAGHTFESTDPSVIKVTVYFDETTETIEEGDNPGGNPGGNTDNPTIPVKHRVTFLDFDNVEFVHRDVYEGDVCGEMSLVPQKRGFKFISWNPDNYATDPVYEDRVVIPVSEIDPTADVSGSEDVSSEGSSGSGDVSGSKGSKKSTKKSTKTTTSTQKKSYTVKFVDYNGALLSTQVIESGKTAGTFPYEPTRKGYKFVSWSPSNYASIPITSDLTVTATYQRDPNYVPPTVSGNSGGATGRVTPRSNTSVQVSKTGISNKNLAAATVDGSNDNFIVKVTDSDEARTAMEQAFLGAYGGLDNLKYFAMDISLYDSTGTTKILNTDGLKVNVTIPIPDAMAGYAGNNKVATCDKQGNLERVNARLITIDNVPCVSFTAPHLSPYAIYVETDNLQAGAGVADVSPKTGDPIHPKWFLAIGLMLASILMFLLRPSRKIVKVIA